MKIITFCHDSISYKVHDIVFSEFLAFYYSNETEKRDALMELIRKTYKPIFTDLMVTDEGYSETQVTEHLRL